VDAACERGFNPARKASVKCDTPYEGAVIWSKEEVRRLVELTERDQSPMGRREAAFLRLRLSSGVANKDILQLKWEQIERKEGQAWVRWRTDAEPVKLEDETWQAMREWLTTSGRWEGMDRGKYIFTPRRPPKQEWTGWKAEDWVEEKPLSARMNRDSLIITGRRLGIDEAKLSWAGLRLTAIKLRLEAGESETGMIQFKQSRDRVEHLRSKLAILPRLAEPEGRLLANPEMRCRHNALFKEGEGTTHGIYMRKKDPLAVQKVMDENIHGIEQEKKCLRRLMKGLRERDLNGERLAEAYSMAAGRLAEIIQASRSIRDTGSEDEKSLQDLRAAIERYKEQVGPLPSHDNGQSAGGDEDPLGGDLWEEVATLRLMLRQIDNRSGACTDDYEYLRLVNLYGLLCTRLVKLVKLEGSQATRIREEFNRIVDQAISQVRKDMGLGPEGRK
jgi:hypothetical protein